MLLRCTEYVLNLKTTQGNNSINNNGKCIEIDKVVFVCVSVCACLCACACMCARMHVYTRACVSCVCEAFYISAPAMSINQQQ